MKIFGTTSIVLGCFFIMQHNVLQIGDVAEIEAENYLQALNLN